MTKTLPANCSCTHPVFWHTGKGCGAEGTECDPGKPGGFRSWACMCPKTQQEALEASKEVKEAPPKGPFGMIP